MISDESCTMLLSKRAVSIVSASSNVQIQESGASQTWEGLRITGRAQLKHSSWALTLGGAWDCHF